MKLPQRWVVTNGLGYQPQGINRLATTINLDQVFGIHFEWDSYERLVKMERSQEELEENYLKPAAVQLAQEVDSRAALFAYQNASNVVGSLGTVSYTHLDVYKRQPQRHPVGIEKTIRHDGLRLSLSASPNLFGGTQLSILS